MVDILVDIKVMLYNVLSLNFVVVLYKMIYKKLWNIYKFEFYWMIKKYIMVYGDMVFMWYKFIFF